MIFKFFLSLRNIFPVFVYLLTQRKKKCRIIILVSPENIKSLSLKSGKISHYVKNASFRFDLVHYNNKYNNEILPKPKAKNTQFRVTVYMQRTRKPTVFVYDANN